MLIIPAELSKASKEVLKPDNTFNRFKRKEPFNKDSSNNKPFIIITLSYKNLPDILKDISDK